MSAAQRVSRGFHRLGLVLAGIVFLIGSIVQFFVPVSGPIDRAITLVASFAVYGLVRAIGWVIGGFVT